MFKLTVLYFVGTILDYRVLHCFNNIQWYWDLCCYYKVPVFFFIASIFKAFLKLHAHFQRVVSYLKKIALLFAEKWVGMGNSHWSAFDWQYGNNIEDMCYYLINLDKDEPTGSSEVDDVEIMDNNLQQSGESSGWWRWCQHWIYIECFCSASYLQLSRNVPHW